MIECIHLDRLFCVVTGRLANKPTRGLVNPQISQLAEIFYLKIEIYNSSECYFRQLTIFICCQ